MNFAELARKLNILPNDLRDKLPVLGFDIGRKAVKVDDRIALRILNEWPVLSKRFAPVEEVDRSQIQEQVLKSIVKLPLVLTVKELSQKLQIPLSKLMVELMNNRILASLNERIDFETASIIAQDFGIKVELEEEVVDDHLDQSGADLASKIDSRLAGIKKEQLKVRPPIVVFMGHVDHGKTTLLDAIRSTNIVTKEAGRITQHIGAYQVSKQGRLITFLDTPGHEVFMAMRSRGAKIADVAVLVVAADDGIQEQTKEVVKIIEAAKIPVLVAINKIDKPTANIQLVKSGLAELNLTPEEFGGHTICVPVSAKAKTGIDELLDMILFVADSLKDELLVNYDDKVLGTVIESYIDPREGVSTTIIVQHGTLHAKDSIVIAGNLYGKIKALKNFLNEPVKKAGPSMPVKILGLKACPAVGEIVETETANIKLETVAKQKLASKSMELHKTSWQEVQSGKPSAVKSKISESDFKILNIVLKADKYGSLEAIITSLDKFNIEKPKLKIISSGLGNIHENDILKAKASNAIIVGFHINITQNVLKIIDDQKVEAKTYDVIYNLLDDVSKNLDKLAGQVLTKIEVGKLLVKKIFRDNGKVCLLGGVVQSGQVENKLKFNVQRSSGDIITGSILSMRSGAEDVSLVVTNEECGIQVKSNSPLKSGDVLEIYREEMVQA